MANISKAFNNILKIDLNVRSGFYYRIIGLFLISSSISISVSISNLENEFLFFTVLNAMIITGSVLVGVGFQKAQKLP